LLRNAETTPLNQLQIQKPNVNRENKPSSRRQCGEIGIEPNRRGTLYAHSTATYPSPRRAMERAREEEGGCVITSLGSVREGILTVHFQRHQRISLFALDS